jgi:large subunit ribosomal protein L6
MSRIGKIPVRVPGGVKVAIGSSDISLEGPKGKVSQPIPLGIAVEQKGDQLLVTRSRDDKQARANHGTLRAHLINMIEGVVQGHKKALEIQGVGFRAQIQKNKLILNLGFSHPVEYEVPEGIKVSTPQPTQIIVEGMDKAQVGTIAAKIRMIKPPEPYKGKGIRYSGELVRRKLGKAVTK